MAGFTKKKSVGLSNIVVGYVGLITKNYHKSVSITWKHLKCISVSVTHHSKIRELSDENKTWKQI